MPPRKPSDRVPSLTLHKASGRAVVRLNGKDVYCGMYGTEEAKRVYDEKIREWLAAGRKLVVAPGRPTVRAVVERFLARAVHEYADGNAKPREYRCFEIACKPLLDLFGATVAEDFGPEQLYDVREEMIRREWARKSINRQIVRVRHVFKRAAEYKLVSWACYGALGAVRGLRKGRARVKESERVLSAPDACIDAALPYCPPAVAAMARLQRETGARPGEIVQLRGRDLDMRAEPWLFTPKRHKNAHRDHERVIPFGPKAREILRPWLKEDPEAYCFSPSETIQAYQGERTKARKTPKTKWQSRQRRVKGPKWKPGDKYTTQTYSRALVRACEKADRAAHEADPSIPADTVVVKPFAANQIRHTRATVVYKEIALKVARDELGHRNAKTTRGYIDGDTSIDAALAEEFG